MVLDRKKMVTRSRLSVTLPSLAHRLLPLAIASVLLIAAFFAFTGSGSTSTVCRACDVPEEEWDKLPAAKRAQQEEINRRYDQALTQSPAPKDPSSGKGAIPPASTPAPWPEGFFENGQFPGGNYQINNQWQDESDGNRIQVHAGSVKSDAEQGLVIVHVTSQDLKSGRQDVYLTPSRSGPLRIVDARDGRLTLLSSSAKVFAFDVTSRTFSDSDLPAWPSGIFQLDEAPFPAGRPFPADVFSVVNVWQGTVDGKFVRLIRRLGLG
jgi:hypothetical protein